MPTVTVFASPTSWIESDALVQCDQVAALDGMLRVAAMPDLHPGKGAPIGAARSTAWPPRWRPRFRWSLQDGRCRGPGRRK